MDLFNILKALHIIGFGVLMSGLYLQVSGEKEKPANRHILYGSLALLLNGIFMIFLSKGDLNFFKIGVKISSLLFVIVSYFIYSKKSLSKNLTWFLVVLSVVMVILSATWR